MSSGRWPALKTKTKRMSQRRSRPRKPRGAGPLNVNDLQRAAALKGYRLRAELTQVELSSMLGVSQSSLAAYEAGRTPIPDDVFAELTRVAEEQIRQAQEKAGVQTEAPPDVASSATGLPSDLPPELAAALQGSGGAEIDPEAILKAMAGAGAGELSKDEQGQVLGVASVYELAGHAAARFLDPALGEAIVGSASPIGVAWVEAAKVSPLCQRIVQMMQIGPLSNLIVLHVLMLMKYDELRQARIRERQQLEAVQTAAGNGKPAPEPMPAQAADLLESPFTVAA